MKKYLTKENKPIIIISSLIIILIILMTILIVNYGNNKLKNNSFNSYKILDEVVELPNTEVISNEDLNTSKCLKDICVSDVKIYATEDSGRIECIVTNNSDMVKSGYLKLHAGDAVVLIAYKEVPVKGQTKAIAQYDGKNLKNVSDYTIEVLTKKEIKSINK